MHELTLPFIGTISIWNYAIGALVLWAVWDHIPAIVGFIFKRIVGFVTKPSVKATVATGVEESLSALQSMTVWAVKEAGPEVLAKITALYADIQQQIKDASKK